MEGKSVSILEGYFYNSGNVNSKNCATTFPPTLILPNKTEIKSESCTVREETRLEAEDRFSLMFRSLWHFFYQFSLFFDNPLRVYTMNNGHSHTPPSPISILPCFTPFFSSNLSLTSFNYCFCFVTHWLYHGLYNSGFGVILQHLMGSPVDTSRKTIAPFLPGSVTRQ